MPPIRVADGRGITYPPPSATRMGGCLGFCYAGTPATRGPGYAGTLLFPYLDLDVFLPCTPAKSHFPRTNLYLTPGKSGTRPPLTNTTECS